MISGCLYALYFQLPNFLFDFRKYYVKFTTAEISCGEPPDAVNAVMEISPGQLFGDVVTYTCESGFEVSEDVTTTEITCQADRQWSELTDCRGNQ